MNDNKNNWGYKLGYALGAVLCGCIAIALIAITIKFIFWIFKGELYND